MSDARFGADSTPQAKAKIKEPRILRGSLLL
jgi:hypothetical protein